MARTFHSIKNGITAVAIAAATLALTPAAGAEASAATHTGAPSCLTYSASWRYTLVTNGCDGTHDITVDYLDGTSVPCRTARPGDTVTFPGRGTGGNDVLGVSLCPGPHPV
ncbi:alpha-amylase [Streptomyces sp. NPDC015131]|uniref:alpha-amylase n=1 Tax=Streptomyces sp. NPDC015131 TaxID=3364941 RepID=UPI003700E523